MFYSFVKCAEEIKGKMSLPCPDKKHERSYSSATYLMVIETWFFESAPIGIS